MNVSLTPELEKYVRSKLRTGRYNSAVDVIRDALRLLQERDLEYDARLAEFNAGIGRRLATLERGERVGPAAVRSRLRRKSDKARQARRSG